MTPEPGQSYYDAILNELGDLTDLQMPLSKDAVGKTVIVNGGEEYGWWGTLVHDIDEEEGVFIVSDRSGQPFFDFIPAGEALDRERAIEKMAEIEITRREQAVEGFIEAIGDAANPN